MAETTFLRTFYRKKKSKETGAREGLSRARPSKRLINRSFPLYLSQPSYCLRVQKDADRRDEGIGIGAGYTSRQLAVRGRRSGGNRDNGIRGNQLSTRASGRPPTQLFPNCANVRPLRYAPVHTPAEAAPSPNRAGGKLCPNLRWPDA